jgi:hypothetical protein
MSNVDVATEGLVPAFVEVEIGGALCGWSRQQSFERVWRDELPAVRFGRRWAVPIVQLERLTGRPVTAADIQRAEAIVRARKAARRAAQPKQVA